MPAGWGREQSSICSRPCAELQQALQQLAQVVHRRPCRVEDMAHTSTHTGFRRRPWIVFRCSFVVHRHAPAADLLSCNRQMLCPIPNAVSAWSADSAYDNKLPSHHMQPSMPVLPLPLPPPLPPLLV